MSNALHGVDQKVTRAKKHRDHLTRQAALYLRRPTHHVKTHADKDGLEHVVRIYRIRPVPPEWAVILGEFLYDLRSALDNLVWALVLANGEQPGRGTYFPILRQENRKAFAAMTAGAHPEAVTVIQSLQPYLRGKRPGVGPLFLLHELNRLDKHQALTVVTAVGARGSFHISPELAGRSTVRTTLQPLHEGAEILRVILKEPQPQVDVKPKADLAVFIMETEATPYLDFPAILGPIHQAVADAVERLRCFT
jgi:hypothetical protein